VERRPACNDDTDAFVTAHAHSSSAREHWKVRIVPGPAGTLPDSRNTLPDGFPDGSYNAGFVLIATGQSSTSSKLDERARFKDPGAPQGLLYKHRQGVAQAHKNAKHFGEKARRLLELSPETSRWMCRQQNPALIGIDDRTDRSNQAPWRSVHR